MSILSISLYLYYLSIYISVCMCVHIPSCLKWTRNPFWNCFSDTKFSDSICLYICCYNNVFSLVWMQTCPQSISYKCKLLKQLLIVIHLTLLKNKAGRTVHGWRSYVISLLPISQCSCLVSEERSYSSNFAFLFAQC